MERGQSKCNSGRRTAKSVSVETANSINVALIDKFALFTARGVPRQGRPLVTNGPGAAVSEKRPTRARGIGYSESPARRAGTLSESDDFKWLN
jgi:hypothetical protein